MTERSIVEDYIAQHDIEGVLNDIINEVLRFRPLTPFLDIANNLKRRAIPEIISVAISFQPSPHDYLYCGICVATVNCSFGSFSCQYPVSFTSNEFSDDLLASWSSKMTTTLAKLDPTSNKLVDKMISELCNSQSPPVPNCVSMAVSCACLKSHAFWRNSLLFQTIQVAYSSSFKISSPLVCLFEAETVESDTVPLPDDLKLQKLLLYSPSSLPNLCRWYYESGYHYMSTYSAFLHIDGSLVYPSSSSLTSLLEAICVREEKVGLVMSSSQFNNMISNYSSVITYCKPKSIQSIQVLDDDDKSVVEEEKKAGEEEAKNDAVVDVLNATNKEIESSIKDCERENSVTIIKPWVNASTDPSNEKFSSDVVQSGKTIYLSSFQTIAQLCDTVDQIRQNDKSYSIVLQDMKESSHGCKNISMHIDEILVHLAVGAGVDWYHVGGIFSIECRVKLHEFDLISKVP